MLTKGREVCYDIMRVQETAPSYGEMSEWLKEPVLKTGGAQVPVGSNPTLSANFSNVNPDLRKYPSGRRGSPAKGVGWIKPARGFKSLLPRQQKSLVLQWIQGFFAAHFREDTLQITLYRFFDPFSARHNILASGSPCPSSSVPTCARKHSR